MFPNFLAEETKDPDDPMGVYFVVSTLLFNLSLLFTFWVKPALWPDSEGPAVLKEAGRARRKGQYLKRKRTHLQRIGARLEGAVLQQNMWYRKLLSNGLFLS